MYDSENIPSKPDVPTYMRPAAVDQTESVDFPVDGYTIGNIADSDVSTNVIQEYQSGVEETQTIKDIPPLIEFNSEDLDVGPLVEFYEPEISEPVVEPYRHPDASVPCSPPRSVSSNDTRSTQRPEPRSRETSPSVHPSQRNLMNQYDAAALITKDYAMNITVKEALKSRGAEAERVILEELSQMINKRVWTPVRMSALTSTEKGGIIRSQMFLKEKYLPSDDFEKLNARLVAGGNQQDRDLYDDLSSPTVSTSVVMTVFTIAAHEKRSAAVVDIGGAFLNADMNTGINVYMRLDNTMSKMIFKLDAKYSDYCDVKGNIVVRLDKALYGCVESAALWYENLSETLQKSGFIRNGYEVCVFNKRANGVQCTIAVHVDDLIITSVDRQMIEDICGELKGRYGVITRHDGPVGWCST